MRRMFKHMGWLLLVACACGDDSAQPNAEADSAVRVDEAAVGGLYHLPKSVDAIVLELRDKHRFRWSLAGCDTFGGAKGRIEDRAPSVIALLPEAAGTQFLWPGQLVTSDVDEVELEVTPDELRETSTGQRWLPGGVCAICGGNLGPTGQRACDDPPFFEDLL